MTARVLVVDDILANVRLLEAKLAAEYFEVVTAMNGVDALESVQRTRPDIVLLDVMMPGIDGIEVCKRIKSNPSTQHIPVVMVTALDQPEDRVRGLEAGADDFLTKPVNDVSLFCRVKSLVRLKMLTDELRTRTGGAEAMGLINANLPSLDTKPGNIMVVDNRAITADRVRGALGGRHDVTIVTDGQQAIELCAQNDPPFELVVISLDMEGVDALRVCSQLKSLETTRQTPILLIVDPDDHQRLLRALDMGVNDYLIRPVDRQELQARVNTQIRRFRYTEQLRKSVQASMEMAVTDSLTGLSTAAIWRPTWPSLSVMPSTAASPCRSSRWTSTTSRRSTTPMAIRPAIASFRNWPGASAVPFAGSIWPAGPEARSLSWCFPAPRSASRSVWPNGSVRRLPTGLSRLRRALP